MTTVFSALSDPTRRKILSMLAKGDLVAGDIAAAFDMSKPSISHHLSALRAAGLVEAHREGQSIAYSINTSVLEDALVGFMELVGVDHGAERGKEEGEAS